MTELTEKQKVGKAAELLGVTVSDLECSFDYAHRALSQKLEPEMYDKEWCTSLINHIRINYELYKKICSYWR